MEAEGTNAAGDDLAADLSQNSSPAKGKAISPTLVPYASKLLAICHA